MPFTLTEWLVVIAAVGTVLTNLIVSWRTSGTVATVKTAILDNTAMTADVGKTVEVVRAHVNSAASVSVTRIDALQHEVQLLRNALAEKTQVAAVLAETAARTERTRATDAKGSA